MFVPLRRLLVFLFIGIVPFFLHAQVNSASLTGLVTDPSNAILKSTTVSATNTATGITRTTLTDNSGYYAFPSLPVGTYTIVIDQSGFQRTTQSITLHTAEKGRLDFQLTVGSDNQTVTVEAQSVQLAREDASIGTVIDNVTVQNTPLYLRTWDDLLRLVAGVQTNRYTEQSGQTGAGRTGGFNVHGVHSLQNDFILDGIDNNTFSENVQELSTEAARPSVDTIQEFKVITNPYSAEYGRSPGAAVDVTTKGGSNQFHGLLFEYLRNRIFDANDYISNETGLKKPENIQNQFGGNFGAPILHDRLFGFINYEGTRIHRGVARLTTVPLPNERIGDFSPATGQAVGVSYPTIYDITTGQPFANNSIPSGRIDPYASKILNLFPLPNQSGQQNNYARTASLTDSNDNYDGRIDWTPTQNDTVFGRYTFSNRHRVVPGTFDGIADGSNTSSWGNQKLKAYSAVLGWTHVFGPTLTNDLRLGFVRSSAYTQQIPFGIGHASDYVPGVPQNPAVDGGLSNITFEDYAFIGSPDFLPKSQTPQQFQYIDTLSFVRGRHFIKVGVDLRAPMRNIFQDEPDARGNVDFSNIFTCQRGSDQQCVNGTGLSYADGLLGYVRSSVLSNVYFVDQRVQMYSAFFQDDFKLFPNLTLNLGLRYDFATPALEAKNHMANFDPLANGGSGGLYFATSGSIEDRSLVQPNTKNFGPRFGFSYAPDQKTVIRGGYGIFYTLFERFGSEDQMALNPPFLINNNAAVASTSTTPVFFLKNGFPSNYLDPNNINYQLTQIRTVNPTAPAPMVQQWSLGFQRELPGQFLLDTNYIGTVLRHLDVLTDLNQPAFVNGVTTGITPFPNFGYLERQSSVGSGSYHGWESTLERRFNKGLSAKVVYTWSHSIDNAPEELENGSGGAQNGYDINAWRGQSDFNTPHTLAASYTWDLPFGKGRAFATSGPLSWILGGFRTSGVYTFRSGRPFTINSGSISSSLDPYGAAEAVPNRIGTPHIVGNINCWFYTSKNSSCQTLAPNLTDAYQLQNSGELGNSGRNQLRGPHTNIFDAAVLRNFPIPIGEATSLQFRWEIFNVANHAQFAQPNSDFTSTSAGKITSLAADPRVMQFALRLSF